jgi:hypothetical protein
MYHTVCHVKVCSWPHTYCKRSNTILGFYMFYTVHCSIIANENQQNAQMIYTRWFKYDRDKLWLVYTQIVPVIFEPPCIFSICSTYMLWLNFNRQHTTQCLNCGNYVYKELYLGWMHILLYYVLSNIAPWRWSSMAKTRRCYKLRKYISFSAFGWFSLPLVFVLKDSLSSNSSYVTDYCSAFDRTHGNAMTVFFNSSDHAFLLQNP